MSNDQDQLESSKRNVPALRPKLDAGQVSHANAHGLNPAQKAAIIVVLLGPEAAKPLIDGLDDYLLQKLLGAYKNLRQIPRETMLSAVAEFITQLTRNAAGLRGGKHKARELAESLLDSDRARLLLGDEVLVADDGTVSPWIVLNSKKILDVARYLNTLPSEISSIILAQLSADKVGMILPEMEDVLSAECAGRLSRKLDVAPTTVQAIGEMVRQEFLNVSQVDENAQAAKFMGEVMSILPKDKRENLMNYLDEKDAKQAERIRQNMMTFEDIPERLPGSAVSILFREMEPTELLKALKAGEAAFPAVTDFLYGNISQRMAGQYKEQAQELPDLSARDADSALTTFMGALSKLEKAGVITLIRVKKPEAET